MKINKVLVTTDLSMDSERPHAIVSRLAEDAGASVTLLSVVEDLVVPAHGAPLAPPIHPIDNTGELTRVRKELEAHANKLGGRLEVRCEVIEGPSVARAIAEYASTNDFDLLAIATHGRSGVRRLILGSVAESVLRYSNVPVLCFPPIDANRQPGRTDIKHILLTTDLSIEALRSFEPVLELAKTLGSRVTVLHVVPEFHSTPSGVSGFTNPRLVRDIASARGFVEDQCSPLGNGHVFDIQVISRESPVKGILEFAREHDVNLIALSTHGRTGFRRLALGSVAEGVLRHSPVPVLSFHRNQN